MAQYVNIHARIYLFQHDNERASYNYKCKIVMHK